MAGAPSAPEFTSGALGFPCVTKPRVIHAIVAHLFARARPAFRPSRFNRRRDGEGNSLPADYLIFSI